MASPSNSEPPAPTALKKWLNSRTVFWLAVLLPLALILGYESSGIPRAHPIQFAHPGGMLILACLMLLTLAAGALVARHQHTPLLPEGRTLWYLFGLATLFSLIGNVVLYQTEALLLISALSAMGTLCLLWAVLKRFALLLWIPFMLFEAVQVGAFLQYGTVINNELIMAEMLEAAPQEAQAYLTTFNICMAALLLLLSCGLSLLLVKTLRGCKRMQLAATGLVSLLAAGGAILLSSPQKRYADNLWPLMEARSLPHKLQQARQFNSGVINYAKALPSPAEKPSSLSFLQPNQGVVVVLHIGESVRADRLTLNGYRNMGRSTTPWLDSQASGPLINFRNCISSSFLTGYALLTILTDARRGIVDAEGAGTMHEEYDPCNLPGIAPQARAQAGSVVDLFAANSFSVYTFMGKLSGQHLKYDMIIRELTRAARERYYSPANPQDVIPHAETVLRQHPGENLFFFINNEGNHLPCWFYDETNAPFQPARSVLENPAAHAEEVNNAYDNSTHYTDEFIRRMVEKLRGRPFIYLYVSDHGENLGHDGIWGRGVTGSHYHQSSACRVGMFLISSPEFRALHPHFNQSINNLRAHADMTVGHEHIYHTLLGIIGISTPYYDAALDLSHDAPEPYTGPQPALQPES